MTKLRRVKYRLTIFRVVALLIISIGVIGGLTTALHAAASASTTPTSTSKFPIPELGIVLTLPSGLSPSDLQYSAQVNRPVTAVDSHPWSTASFTTKSLLQLDSGCSADEASIGVIVRYTEDPKTIHAEVNSSQQIGNHYFAIAAPQGTCSENPQAEQLEGAQSDLLQQAFKSVEASN